MQMERDRVERMKQEHFRDVVEEGKRQGMRQRQES